MKKTFFAPVRAGILLSAIILLCSFVSKESFFDKVYASLKGKIGLQLQSYGNSTLEIVPTSNLSFNPGATCSGLAANAIGGLVWEDIRFDGDTSTEQTVYGVAGIHVTIFNHLNELVQTTTTDVDGNYLFSNLIGNQYRVEFTIPTNMQSYTKPTVKGINSHTSIQFVTVGNCANLGVSNPSRYCDDNPLLITPCFISGNPLAGGSAGEGDVLVSYPYADGATKSDVNLLALNKEIGSTWGVAYAKTSKDIYAAALVKRHTGFGPLGIGGIYRINDTDPSNPVIEEWLDLAKEGIDVGENPRMVNLPNDPITSSSDPEAFDAVGKIGLGDLDISEDEKSLYVLNLNNNGALVTIDIASKKVVQNIPIANPGCGTPEDVRPWALSVYKGAIYVGLVCSGEIAGGGDMQFFVQKYEDNTVTTVLNESLNYEKGFVHLTYNKGFGDGAPILCKNWETWVNDFSGIHTANSSVSGPRWCRPQPILSNIDFDLDGSMVLAFMDRTGHQTGYLQATTDPNNTLLGNGYIGGDILRAHNNQGTFVLESGGKTLDGKGSGLNNLLGSIGADTVIQGPGGGEFYSGEKFSFLHQETSMGGMVLSPHDNNVALNVMDPTKVFTGGTMWLSNATGESERVFVLYDSDPTLQAGTFGKAAGLGDLELSCAAAPIELGNYVWDDKNSDGIQNPEEPGIDGVKVELVKGGIVIASTTTQNGGQYYFTADGTAGQTWTTPGDKVLPEMEYCIRIALDDPSLSESVPTLPNKDDSPNGDARDNDAEPIDGYAKITLTTGGSGETAHEYDFGFTSNLCLGDYVWLDKNTDGIQDDNETGIDGITVELVKDNAVVATTTTANGGQYLFTAADATDQNWVAADGKVLPEMDYIIRIPLNQNGLAKLKLTDINQTDDLKDSDGSIHGDYATIALVSGKPGSLEHHYDFGFQPTLCVGNLVWLDSNNNGTVEASENGIAGVEVILYQVTDGGNKGEGNDVEIARDTTNDQGNYLFTDLAEGVYFIKINDGIPTTLNSSTGSSINGTNSSTYEPGLTTSTDIDNDDNGSQMGSMVMSDTFTLAICTEPTTDGDDDSNTNLSVDFGFIPNLSIGNLVWDDLNNNGQVDGTEKGIAGVTVELYQLGPNGQKGDADDVLVKSIPTGDNGDYLFDQLNPGDYYVKLNGGIPSGMISSTGQGLVLTIGSGPTEPAVDPNNNQNNNDDGTQMGAMIMSDVVNLAIGQEPDNDGDTNKNTNLSIDFGLFSFMCLGDYVWLDKNTNGIQDDDENGIANIEVELVKDRAVVATTTTDADGQYFFTLDGAASQNWTTSGDRVLANMDYSIRIALDQSDLATYQLTTQDNTSDDKDNDAKNENGYAIINLRSGAAGTITHDYDFGFIPTLSVGNLVWLDANNNGQADMGEEGIADVEVILYQLGGDGTKGIGNDTEIARDTTDRDGIYSFTQLPEGIYFIKINDGIPNNLTSSSGTGVNGLANSAYEPGIAASTDIDNDDNGSQMGTMVMSDTFTLAICTEPETDGDNDSNTNLSIDFGFIPCLSIGNLVFNDINNNGAQDGNEPAMEGIQVELYQVGEDGQKSEDDVLVGNQTTKEDGLYRFDELKPGDYYVKLNGGIPDNMISSTGEGTANVTGSGPNEPAPSVNQDNTDSDDNGTQMGTMVMTDIINLGIGQEPTTDGDNDPNTNLTVDFGLFELMALGNLVWKDANNNGVVDQGEKGAEGVEAILFQVGPDGEKATADDVEMARDTTDKSGHYLFTHLRPGAYYVKLADGIPFGYGSATGEGIMDVDGVGPYEEDAPSPDTDIDNDDNGNQMNYMIMSDLVHLVAHDEPQNDGDKSNQTNLTVDFGLFQLLRLGNLVWEDYDNDGQKDVDEPGIPNVEAILYQVGPDGEKATADDVIIATDITDEDGHYLFVRLLPGDYYVKLNNGIDGFSSSTGEGVNQVTGNGAFEIAPDPDNDVDNEDNGTQMGNMVMSELITLDFMGEPSFEDNFVNSNFTLDFGLFQPLTIGNLVWHDLNNDGFAQATEPGFANIDVVLFEAGPDRQKSNDDIEIGRTRTNANGNYNFSNLKPGNYYVKLLNIPRQFISSNGQGAEQVSGNGLFEPGAITNTDINSDDNGTQMGNMIMSDLVTMQLYREPINDGDADRKTNLAVDFGLLRVNEIRIHNPCTCLNNESSPNAGDGQFAETITILSNTSGQIWVITEATGAFYPDNIPVVPQAVAQESGTEDGRYRYIFDVRHVDGQGYTVKFSNGSDELVATNLCNYNESCHRVAPPPTCTDCTPGPPQPDPCLMTFIMGTDGMHMVDSLNCCDDKSTFTDDGLVDGLYADTLGRPRDDIFTICPQNQWQTLTYHFSEFGLEEGDTLFVYDGRTVTDSLLGKFSGAGVGQTGGWVASTCSPSKNASGCLTFRLITDGDNNKDIGWNGNFVCTDRDIQLTPPNITSPKLACQVTTTTVTINPATITADCGTVQDTQIVRIYNSKGKVCKDTCLAFDKSFDEVFAIGQYRIEYKLKTDTVKAAETTFTVQGAAHVCNDLVRIPLGSNCAVALSPDDLLERTCDTIPDTMYYFITVKGLDKNGQEEVIVTGGGSGQEYPVVTKEQFVKYGGQLIVDIEKRYYENLTFNICNSGVQSETCRTRIEIEDNSGPIFGAVTRDTFKVCDIDLTEEGLALTKPNAIDNCNEVEVVFSSVNIINDGGVCDTTRAEVIWAAVDSSGNQSTIVQNIVLYRSDINDIVKPGDRELTCGTDTEADFNNFEKAGVPGIKIGKVTNGVLVPSDTMDLDTEKYICGFILQKRDVQINADCGKKLFRYWDVLDWCQPNGGPIQLDTQFINLKDVTPPSFTQETLPFKYIDLDHLSCTYDITKLGNPTATDNCSAVTVSLDKVYRIEDGALWEIPATDFTQLDCDSFRIRWIAEDACHEQTEFDVITQDVLIQDVTKPSAVCTDQITVSIGTDAIKMHYSAFEAGSFDACGIDKYEVSRDEENWGDYVEFDCRDVHQTPKVFLRVTDKKGNQSTCWTNVLVEDKIKPICSDLPDQMGTCDAQHADVFGPSTDTNGDSQMSENEWVDMTEEQVAFYNNEYGHPNCSDNAGECQELIIQQQYQLIPWPCGMLEIKRRVRAIDWMGEGNVSNWVEQNIKIEYKANWNITFPADWVGSCAEEIPSSETYVTNGTCDLLAVEMNEKTFVTDEVACLKVIRTFTVINWCTYQVGEEGIIIARDEDEHGTVITPRIITALGNEKVGKITYTQVLKIIDDQAPVVSILEPDSCIYGLDGDAAPYGLEDITPGSSPFECDELKTWTARAGDCAGEENITWVSKLYRDGQVVYQGSTNRIEYIVENKSTYQAEFWAYDGCGNSGGAKTEPKKFWDCKKPTPYCIHGVATELMPSGMIQVWAKDLDQGSYDNCTPSHRLDLRIWHLALGSPPTTLEGVRALPKQITFNCVYLGVQDVQIYAIDEEGNWDYCVTYVDVQDNMGACEGRELQVAKVEGTISDWKGNTLEAVQVTTADNFIMTTPNGQFSFELPMNVDYTVTPQKDVRPLNGVSTFDLVLISKHILGSRTFNDPHQFIAADVNQSGSITAFDMVQLRRLILNLDTEFANNTSWKFVEAKYQFTTNNPAGEDFPTLASVNNLAQDMQMDFTAIKIGDVNGNAKTSSLVDSEDRTTKATFTIETEDRNLVAGQTYTVDFSTQALTTIEGYQFTLGTGNLQFEQLINGITSVDNFGLHKINQGYITTSWNNQQLATSNQKLTTLFSITFTATTDSKLSEQLSLVDRPTAIEAYNTDGELLDVQLNLTNTSALTKSFELYQNQPNPFVKETNIRFYLPQKSEVVLTLRDEMGRLLQEIKTTKAAGEQQISINSADLPTGLIYYQISSEFGTQTKKMLRVE